MINHVRTLLLAKRSVDVSGTFVDAYVEPGFTPPVLPPALAAARSIIVSDSDWGADPGRVRAASLLATWLQCVHLRDLEPLTLRLDSRVTYDTGMGSLSAMNAPRTRVEVFDDSGTLTAYTTVTGAGPDTATYTLTGLGDRVTIRKNGKLMRVERVVFTNKVSQPIQLQPGTLSVVLVADSYEFPSSALVRITSLLVTPADMTARMADILKTPLVAGLGLFNVDSPELQALRVFWLDAPTVPVRMGAFALAVAYNIERVRLGIT